jgi:perosamine synthetase
MSNFINYGRQNIDTGDIENVVQALQSDFLTQGPRVEEFEQAICDYTGAKYCVALSNATAGLHLAVAALGLPEGAEGITSPITFVASANCLLYNGLKPVFADVEPDTANIDPAKIKKACTANTKVLLPVHFTGRPCRMEEIARIAKENRLYVIEDAAHAIGSAYPDGGKVGNCRYSDLTVFSFHPVKTITTGEGGAVTTNSEEFYKKLLMLRSHGITKDAEQLHDNPGPWYYEMQELGFNYRLTDLQAALGTSQMRRLDAFKAGRKAITRHYSAAFSDLRWLTPPPVDEADSCFHLYVVQIDFDALGKSRAEVMQILREQGIGTQVHYIPVHTQPYYRRKLGYATGAYPQAEKYYTRALSLPLYPAMSGDDMERVIAAVRNLPS